MSICKSRKSSFFLKLHLKQGWGIFILCSQWHCRCQWNRIPSHTEPGLSGPGREQEKRGLLHYCLHHWTRIYLRAREARRKRPFWRCFINCFFGLHCQFHSLLYYNSLEGKWFWPLKFTGTSKLPTKMRHIEFPSTGRCDTVQSYSKLQRCTSISTKVMHLVCF